MLCYYSVRLDAGFLTIPSTVFQDNHLFTHLHSDINRNLVRNSGTALSKIYFQDLLVLLKHVV